MRLKLDKQKVPHGYLRWNDCEPFVENSHAVLIHRPRFVTVHKITEKHRPHLAVHSYCGNTSVGTKKYTFITTLNENMILCAKCEENAVKAGLPSAEDICGHHVHIGGVKAVMHCCNEYA